MALVIACGLAFGLPSSSSARARQAATGTSAQANQESIDAGKKLYASACVFCHGEDGKGASAPALRGRSLTAQAAASVVSNGKPGTAMPPFKGNFDQAQIADLTAYVLSLLPSALAGSAAPSSSAATTSANLGETIYTKQCASCHEAGQPPYLNRIVMKAAAPEYIVHMLASGVMHVQGSHLTPRERNVVAVYITGKRLGSSTSVGLCSTPAPGDGSGPQWNGWGVDLVNSRFQPADQAGLTAAQVPNLKLKWAFGLLEGFSSYSQPTVVGGRVFVGGPLGEVYSLDAATGCTRWRFQADAGVRTAVTVGPGHLAYFGDLRANVYAVNALTGKLVWRTRISTHPYARVTGTPRLYKGRLYVPVSSREEWIAASPQYECCTFRGILAALDAATGKEIWRTYTIPEPARPTKKSKAGTQLWGPSGAGLWSSPTIDVEHELLYIGTGDNYSDPATSGSDAVLAIDLQTGKIVWSNQITPGDTFNVSCFRDDLSNCPEKAGPDVDFAAPPILRVLPNGRRVLVVGQKSGDVFGLDPDKKGEILWKTNIGHGGALGGVEWGPAADAEVAYVALSDFGFSTGPEGEIPDSKGGGGLFAIKIATGEKIWVASPAQGGCKVARCSPAQSAAVSAIAGAVFSGADDGHIRAYSTQDGKIIWDFDTVRQFDTVNKVPAHGGSIDGGGPAIAGGMVFVNAGYGSLFGIPGNVLLAFSVK
jgi:polyvinyl alcohol dehydrogenase (cytochrome)